MAIGGYAEYLEKVAHLHQRGRSQTEIEKVLGLPAKTLSRWKKKHLPVAEALATGIVSLPKLKSRKKRKPSGPRGGQQFSAGGYRKYKGEFAQQAYKLCQLGAINRDLAGFFGVVETTITRWRKKHPEFKEATDRGKDVADSLVVQSLFKRATGMVIKRVYFTAHKGEIIKQEYDEELPPDVAACFIWLKNRRPNEWRDKHEITVGDSAQLTPWDEIAGPEKVIPEKVIIGKVIDAVEGD